MRTSRPRRGVVPDRTRRPPPAARAPPTRCRPARAAVVAEPDRAAPRPAGRWSTTTGRAPGAVRRTGRDPGVGLELPQQRRPVAVPAHGEGHQAVVRSARRGPRSPARPAVGQSEHRARPVSSSGRDLADEQVAHERQEARPPPSRGARRPCSRRRAGGGSPRARSTWAWPRRASRPGGRALRRSPARSSTEASCRVRYVPSPVWLMPWKKARPSRAEPLADRVGRGGDARVVGRAAARAGRRRPASRSTPASMRRRGPAGMAGGAQALGRHRRATPRRRPTCAAANRRGLGRRARAGPPPAAASAAVAQPGARPRSRPSSSSRTARGARPRSRPGAARAARGRRRPALGVRACARSTARRGRSARRSLDERRVTGQPPVLGQGARGRRRWRPTPGAG